MTNRRRIAGAGWCLAVVALLGVVALFAYAPIFSVDFFWHLKLGELIATERAIPTTDLFSAVHPERPYVQFQWLWDLLAYEAYRIGGLRGVRILQVVVLVASYAALGWASLKTFQSRTFAFAFCALALVLFEDRFQARPSSTVLGLLAVALPWIMAERPRASAIHLTLVALLACIWSNLHSGEALLIVLCLGALAVGHAITWRRGHSDASTVRAASLQTAAAAIGVLLSPALLPGLRAWLGTIGPQLSSGNREWLPSYTMLSYGWSPSHVLIAFGPSAVLIAYLAEQWRTRHLPRPDASDASWPEWLLCGGLLALAHQAVRNSFLCLVPLAFMLRRSSARTLSARTQWLAIGLGAVLLLAAFHNHVFEGYGGISEAESALASDLGPNTFPEELAVFMHEAEIEGPVLNDGRWGGYLIWKTWPRCHVFVDSRQDLGAEMWPVFLASQAPHTRPEAMARAFRRWGVELAAFRGPTFPAVRAASDWQLLYKAGDQELYQHTAGPRARANTARAQGWLHRRAKSLAIGDPPADLAALATLVGAETWLSGPNRRFRRQQARTLIESTYVDDRVRGLSMEASMLYDAGLYQASLPLLQRVLALDPQNASARYRSALASFALGREAESRYHLARLEQTVSALSRHQVGRLAVLARELSRGK